MEYNIYIENEKDFYDIMRIKEDDLKRLVEAFDLGKEAIFINGEKQVLSGLKEIKIFSFEGDEETILNLYNSEKGRSLLKFSRITGRHVATPYALKEIGKDITKDFIKDDFGWKKAPSQSEDIFMLKVHFVNLERIQQLKELKASDFDFKKLIRMCEEVNIAYNLECVYAVGNLLRSIIDHVAPIFGFRTFKEVANNYSGKDSFKEAMKHLDESLRKIADSFLHNPIRKNEVLPTINQVNFIAPVDLLLGEIIRVTKN